MECRCITNNPMVIEKGYPNTESISGDTLSVLLNIKTEVLKGYRIISHPLSSSIRPDMNPYKTVLISKSANELDEESLRIINNAINYTKNLVMMHSNPILWDEQSLNDFQIIDLEIVMNIIPC